MKRRQAIALFCVLAQPARANDSEAELALGGLALKKSDAITMESEDLFISRDLVRVKYRFTNTSETPVETLVAFPLPDIPAEEIEGVAYWRDARDLKFKTTINGKPAPLEIVEQAIFKGRDISAELNAAGIPLNPTSQNFKEALNKAPKSGRDKLIAEGALADDGDGKSHIWTAHWSLRTNVTRRHAFPAHSTVEVEHQYVPRAGGGVGGRFDPQYRGGDNAKYFGETRKKYCIDDDWLKSFDAQFNKRKRVETLAYPMPANELRKKDGGELWGLFYPWLEKRFPFDRNKCLVIMGFT
ncbi:MAG: DUF4424 domain-containing protein, partial [Methylocystis sp.]|nr:DUF4424 domain-containing protein [Methylocystis sp.]